LIADLGARLPAEEEVDECYVGPGAGGERDRLLPRPCGEAALDPRLALEQQPESPLDDVVVVDHQHPQAEPVIAHDVCGTSSRTCQRSGGTGPNSTMPLCSSASTVASRSPSPAPGAGSRTPSFITSRTKVPS